MITTKDQLLTAIENRSNFLKGIIEEKKTALASAPDGTLRVCTRRRSKKEVQFYHRLSSDNNYGTYMRKGSPLVGQLAQKDYDRKVLYEAQKEYSLIYKLICNDLCQAET